MVPITRLTLLLVFMLAAMQTSCVSYHVAPKTENFDNIHDLQQLEGVYQNRGQSNGQAFYLSAILWRDLDTADNNAIEEIEVRSVGNKRLLVTARSGKSVIREKIFEEEIDFKIVDGRIRIQQKIGMANEGFAGPTYKSAELGLDSSGNGKYNSTFAFTGLAFLIPVAAYENEEVRFVKIRNSAK